MNQLFDGKDDKTTLAHNKEWAVPQNSTSMCLGVQPQSFFKTLQAIGKTTWQESHTGRIYNNNKSRFILNICTEYILPFQVVLKYIVSNILAAYFFRIYLILKYKEYFCTIC